MVDDDDAFRLGLEANLVDDGHPVTVYPEPPALAATSSLEMDVAVLDYEMPRVNGLTLADAIHAAHPEVPIVLVTAYWTSDLEKQLAARPFVRLCRKPVDYDALHEIVHAAATEPGGSFAVH